MITREMLINEFVKTNWDDTAITVDTGDVVVVTPCAYEDISSVEDCEYFLMNSDVVYLCGYEDIDDVVNTLNGFAEIKEKSYTEEEKLRDYYNKHLRDATEADWELSHRVSDVIYDMWVKTPERHAWFDFADAHMSEVADSLGIAVESAQKAFNLSCDADWYSDWHKDVYGYRPR